MNNKDLNELKTKQGYISAKRRERGESKDLVQGVIISEEDGTKFIEGSMEAYGVINDDPKTRRREAHRVEAASNTIKC